MYSLTYGECVATVCCGDCIDVVHVVCERLRRDMRLGAACEFWDVIWQCWGLCGGWHESELFVVNIWQMCAIVALFVVAMFNQTLKGCIR